MLTGIKHITANDIEYPIAFTLNVIENIQEKYGSIDVWSELVQPEEGEPQIKDIKWIYTEIINEGIDIENENKGEKRAFITLKQAGRIITNTGLENAKNTVTDLTVSSIKSDQVDTVKNEITTQNL